MRFHIDFAILSFVHLVLASTKRISEDVDSNRDAYEAALSQWRVANNVTDMKRSAQYSAFYCANTNWGAPCVNHEFASGEWNQFIGTEDFDNTKFGPTHIGSFGPAKGVYCVWEWIPARGENVYSNTVSNPGEADIGSYWYEKISQFKCWW